MVYAYAEDDHLEAALATAEFHCCPPQTLASVVRTKRREIALSSLYSEYRVRCCLDAASSLPFAVLVTAASFLPS
jgi:hypothetical protein